MYSLVRFVRLLPRHQRVRAILLFLLMLLGASLEAVGVGVVLPFLALVADPTSVEKHPLLATLQHFSGARTNREFVVCFGVGLIVVYVAKNAFLAGLLHTQYRFIYARQAELTSKLFAAYLRKPYTFHLRRNSSTLLRNVNSEVMLSFSNVILPASAVLIEALVTGAIVVLLVAVEPVATIISAAALGATGGIFLRAVRSRIARSGVAAQKYATNMVQAVNQGLEGVKEIKVLGREGHFVQEFSRQSASFSETMRYYRLVVDSPRLFIEALAVVVILSIAVNSVYHGARVGELISMLGVFALAAIRLMPALNRIMGSMTAIRANMPSFDAIYDDLREAAEADEGRHHLPESSSSAGPSAVFQTALELRDVTFTYPGAHAPSLNGVNLSVIRGQSVALIGSSGAGKTTLVDLVLGLLEPTKGEILLDGKRLSKVVEEWRKIVGYIPQPVFLADDTIRRNVAFGVADDAIDDERVLRALEIARLRAFVEGLPEKLDTSIGERGVRLSGGQRQRIGIARAVYHDPQVLILDEATSALDNETESQIKNAIDDLSRERTVIIIAHRLTTVQNCDLLFFMKDGRVVASAPYERLLETSPDFERMVKAGLLLSAKPAEAAG